MVVIGAGNRCRSILIFQQIIRFYGEMANSAKVLKSNQQCLFLGRLQFGEMAIWSNGYIPTNKNNIITQ